MMTKERSNPDKMMPDTTKTTDYQKNNKTLSTAANHIVLSL